MDRREALQKMMAGGAVVVGASMVSSSPVFATSSLDGGQPVGADIMTPPAPVATSNGKRSNTWVLTAPTDVGCSSGTTQVESYGMVSAMSSNVSVQITPSGFGYVQGNTATLTVVGLWPGNSPFRQGDMFEVIWSVRYSCMSGTDQLGCQIVDYTYRYVNLANGNPDWQQIPIAPVQRSC